MTALQDAAKDRQPVRVMRTINIHIRQVLVQWD